MVTRKSRKRVVAEQGGEVNAAGMTSVVPEGQEQVREDKPVVTYTVDQGSDIDDGSERAQRIWGE